MHTVELEIKLEVVAADDLREPGEKLIVVNDAHAVAVEQNVVDAGIALNPFDEFKKPGMQRRLAAGKLEDFNSAFAVNNALNAPLQFLQRHGVHFVAGAGRRVRVASRATEIARVDNFDERQAGGELLDGCVAAARCIPCLIATLFVASPDVWKTTTFGGRTPTPNAFSVRWLASYAGLPGIEKL